jgi:hypothetical protein
MTEGLWGTNTAVFDAAGNNIGVVWGGFVVGYDNNVLGTINAAGTTLTYNNGSTATVTTNNMTINSLVDNNTGQLIGEWDANGRVWVANKQVGSCTMAGGVPVNYTPNGGATQAIGGGAGQVTSVQNNANVLYVYASEGKILGLVNNTPVLGVRSVVTNDGRTGTYTPAVWNAGVVTTPAYITIGTTNYRVDLASPNLYNETVVNKSADIYVYDGTVDAYSNFHGIIFGGTAAVSKDKAKELDKAVKNSIRSDVPGWAWEIGETPSNILNTSLMGNVFYAYRAGTPTTESGVALTNYYAPASLEPVFSGRYAASNGVRTYTSASQATANNATIVGKIYTMDFYHFEYVTDPLTGVKDWTYLGTITAEYIVDENTGVMTQLPFFY